jgi:hypothetical protein
MRSILIASSLLLLGACASADGVAAAPGGRDCFRNADVSGYSTIDDDTLGVRVSPSRNYTLSAPRLGRDVRWENVIALNSDSGWICTGNGLGVEVIGGEPRRTIQIRAVTRVQEPAPAQGS